MHVETIERIIFHFELIRVFIRMPANKNLKDYKFQRRTPGYVTIDSWKRLRLMPIVGTWDFVVIDGHGSFPHWNTTLETLRATYKR
jgi:hypothetical protein